MNPYEKINSIIEQEASGIAAELIEIRMYEVDRLKAQLQVRLKQSIVNSLKHFEVSEEKELNTLLDKQKLVGTGNQVLNREIGKLHTKIKDARRVLHTIRDWDEYLSLKKYVRDTFGDSAMEGFYKDKPKIEKERKKNEESNRMLDKIRSEKLKK